MNAFLSRPQLPVLLVLALLPWAPLSALTLEQALQQAEREAPALQAWQLQQQAAGHDAEAAGQLPDPKLGFGLQNIPLQGDERGRLNADGMSMQMLGLMQEVPNRARREAQRELAQATRQRMSAELAVQRLEVRLGMAEVWLRLRVVEQQLALFPQLLEHNRVLAAAVTEDARATDRRTIVCDSKQLHDPKTLRPIEETVLTLLAATATESGPQAVPTTFRALLERYAGRAPVAPERWALLEALQAGKRPVSEAPQIGLRSAEEIAARLALLTEDAACAPIEAGLVDDLEALVAIAAKAPAALSELQAHARAMPWIDGSVLGYARRLDALDARGIDVAALDFEGSYGRTTLEYYDGFVFGFYAEARPELPPVATGGRYDALTAVLGQGRSIPAVGGVIRPALVAALKGAG